MFWILSLWGTSTIGLLYFSHRQLSQITPGDACLINSGIHSQLSGSDPVSGGSVCTSATQAEVSQPVSLPLNSHSQLLIQDHSSHRGTGEICNSPGLRHLSRRDQGVSGQPVSIMVEGVQVTLPSYEEAVSSSRASASSESRVQIVLSEGQHTTAAEAGPSRPSYLKQQQSESVVVHPTPLSSSSPSPSSSTWALEHAGTAASSSSHRRPSAGRDQHNLSLDSEMDYSDGSTLIRHRSIHFRWPTVSRCVCVCRYAAAERGLKAWQNSDSDQGSDPPGPVNMRRLELVRRNQPNPQMLGVKGRSKSH